MTKPPYIIDYLGVLAIDVNKSDRKIINIHRIIRRKYAMNQSICNFVHFSPNISNPEIIKLDQSHHNAPHCTINPDQLADYKLEFYGTGRSLQYDIYLDKESLFDVFITLINDVRTNDTLEFVRLENIVHPDERYLYKTHANLLNNKLLQVFCNKDYTLYCYLLIKQEEIEGKKTGRIILSFDFSFKLFFLKFNINTHTIETKLNSDQIMDMQTAIYKEFKEENKE